MARKPGGAGSSGTTGAKRAATGSRSRSGSGSRTVAKRSARSSSGSRSDSSQMSAADALLKLIESPLVAELLTVGATAALAAIAANGLGRSEGGRRSTRVLKAAGKAAANAMSQRLATEIDEIRRASERVRTREEA